MADEGAIEKEAVGETIQHQLATAVSVGLQLQCCLHCAAALLQGVSYNHQPIAFSQYCTPCPLQFHQQPAYTTTHHALVWHGITQRRM